MSVGKQLFFTIIKNYLKNVSNIAFTQIYIINKYK